MTPRDGRRVPPFGNPRIKARKTAPRGLSQSTTSFIGPWCQGIHRTPIKTTHNTGKPHPEPTTPRQRSRTRARGTQQKHTTENKDTRVHYTVHNQPTHTPTTPPHHHHNRQQQTTRREAEAGHKGHAAPDPDSMPPPPHHKSEEGRAPPTHPAERRVRGERAPVLFVRPPRQATRGPGDAPVRAPAPRRPLDP